MILERDASDFPVGEVIEEKNAKEMFISWSIPTMLRLE